MPPPHSFDVTLSLTEGCHRDTPPLLPVSRHVIDYMLIHARLSLGHITFLTLSLHARSSFFFELAE